jgi:hypothetical protein
MNDEIQTPQDAANAVEPVSHYVPHLGAGAAINHAWATVTNGVVTEIKVLGSHLPHPFAEHEAAGGRVVNITAVPCAVGYVVDTHGNVAPPPVVTADAQLIAPNMPAAGAQAGAVQADPVVEKAISHDEMNERRSELVDAAEARQAEEDRHHDAE